jgi:AcrR family transcriptional regulator
MASDNNGADYRSDKDVQERLLDAAEELFCENGFAGTSIREIAAAAKCNLASVSYYFGGKEKLYTEVWRRHILVLRDRQLASIEKVMSEEQGKPSLEGLLRSFAETFVGSLVDETESSCLIKLMSREMLDRHLPSNMFVDEMIKPTLGAMQKALGKTSPDLQESQIPLVIFSVVGQLIHLVRVRTMFKQNGGPDLPTFDLAEAVEHIVKFSTAGIRAYASETK